MTIRKKIYVGWWDGEPIWRYETAEEMLEREKVDIKAVNLYIALSQQ